MSNTIIIAKANKSKLVALWLLENLFLFFIYPFCFIAWKSIVFFFIIPFHLYQFYKMKSQFYIRFELLTDSFIVGDYKYNYDEIESLALNRYLKSQFISPLKSELEGISIKTNDGYIHEMTVFHY